MITRFSEGVSISQQILKNALMGIGAFQALRSRVGAGRTTGAYDPDEAVDHALATIAQYRKGISDAGLPISVLEGKSVLEIGPGRNLAVELGLIGMGAEKAYALDRFADVSRGPKEAAVYEKLITLLEPTEQARCREVIRIEENLPIFSDRVKYFGNCPLEQTPNLFGREFDAVFAHLALEHVANLDAGIHATATLLRQGGLCVFVCNLRSLGGVFDHERAPLQLLNYSS